MARNPKKILVFLLRKFQLLTTNIKLFSKSHASKGSIVTTSTEISSDTIVPYNSNTQIERRAGVSPREVPASNSPRHPTTAPEAGLYPIHDKNELARFEKELAPEELFPVDIVAVHGINGDAFASWRHENGYFWLDSLPKVFPGARVFTYSYNAKVINSPEKGNFDSWARGLLWGLKENRPRKYERRPIIFICHSMGGIVVKKAMNIAGVDKVDYSKIRDSTTGIAFLSTPHGGSDAAAFASTLATMINLPLFGIIRREPIKNLEKGSAALYDIALDFRHFSSKVKIYSFFEMRPIPGLKSKIVDDDSGSMHIAQETPLPMDGCDHRTICRYESDQVTPYKRVVSAIQGLVDLAVQSQ